MTKLEQEMYTLTKLKQLGFNDKLISELLPLPTLKPNPYYKCAPDMKLWSKEIVLEAMESTRFKQHLLRRNNYVLGAKKAVETKKEKLMNYFKAKTLQIRVIVISKKMLRNDAIINRKANNYDLYDEYEPYYKKTPEEVVQRWMVNYIRHNLTAYDEELYELDGKVGKSEVYIFYKTKVLEAISKAYPYLKDEVNRQIERIQAVESK